MSNRFEYNFTRQNEFEQLRQKNEDMQRKNEQLMSQVEQLVEINQELSSQIEELIQERQNESTEEQMQEQIQLLTREVEDLHHQIQISENTRRSSNFNPPKSQASDHEDNNQQTEQVVSILEQLTEEFQNMQGKYMGENEELQQELGQLKQEWLGNFEKLQQQYQEKIQTFQDVITQLKRKDELVSAIEDKVKNYEDSLSVFMLSNNNKSTHNSESNAKKPIAPDEQTLQQMAALQEESNELKQKLINREEQIEIYKNLVGRLKDKLLEKS